MNSKHMMMSVACAAAVCGSVWAEDAAKEQEETKQGWNWAMGEGVTYNETSIVSAEVGLSFDSKFLSYGFVDNNDPIMTPSASITLFDWVYANVESVFDMTPYGRKKDHGGEPVYRNRASKYTELDPGAGIAHAFSPDDYEWLPTTVEFDLGYMYEYHPRSFNTRDDDTQFVTLSVGLPDLWVEPTFTYERDIDRDDGTYLNLELGHTFEIVESLTLRPSVAQGFGNAQRVGGSAYAPYATTPDDEPLRHAGLMDTCIKCELAWEIYDGVTLSGYVAYSDFIFDRQIRDAARSYEGSGQWDESWNFIGGLAMTVAF